MRCLGSAEGAKKKGLLSALLGKKGDKENPGLLSDPVRVRSLLEEQVVSNQALSLEQERSHAEIRRLRHLLEAAKAERDEAALANEKLAAAAAAKSKVRKSLGGPSSSAVNTPVKPARAP